MFVGKLNWIGNQTKPDALFNVCQLSAKMKCPIIKDMIDANKVLCQLKTNPLVVRYPRLRNLESSCIFFYADASLGNLESGNSAGGFVVFVVDSESGKACPIIWKTKTFRRVVRSTLAAETSAVVDALDVAYFVSKVFHEMLYGTSKGVSFIPKGISGGCTHSLGLMPIHGFTDNNALYRNANSTTMVTEKRVQVDIAVIKQMLERGELICFQWVPSEKQLADSLTKRGADSLKLTVVFERGRLFD